MRLIYVITVGLSLIVNMGYAGELLQQDGLVTQFYETNQGKAKPTSSLVFLLGGSEGGIWEYNSVEVQTLLKEGFNVVTAGYFGMDGTQSDLSEIDLGMFTKAISHYKGEANTKKVCFIGVSKGAELALTLASLTSDITCVAALVPSHVVFQASNISLTKHSSWKFQGNTLPFVPYPIFSLATIKGVWSGENYNDMHLEALANKEAENKARIKVENINGPILLISARDDQYWPSVYMADEIVKRLDEYQFPYTYEHYEIYSNHFVLSHGALPIVMKFLDNHFRGSEAH